MKKSILSILTRLGIFNKTQNFHSSELLTNAVKFAVNNCVEGDYYEFGVFKGQNFVGAYNEFQKQIIRRLNASQKLGSNPKADKVRYKLLQQMKFYAFDSFEGLPPLSKSDGNNADFVKGQFRCDVESFERYIADCGVPNSRVFIHSGWFSNTCSDTYLNKNEFGKASLIWLDCDLYSSAAEAFNLIEKIIQDGTIIVLDDWYSFNGSKFYGVQKAFHEFIEKKSVKESYYFNEYLTDSWKRKSFIANKRPIK